MAVLTTYPGVYIEEVPSGVRPIESASTSTAAFIGQTAKGPAEPTLIFKWADYVEKFAEENPTQILQQLSAKAATAAKASAEAKAKAEALAEDPEKVTEAAEAAEAAKTAKAAAKAATKALEDAAAGQPCSMWLAVYAFFLNGGGATYIVNADNTAGAYDDAFASLEKIRDVSIICLPGKEWNASDKGIIESAISHAEKMKNRMVIVDLDADTKLTSKNDVIGENGLDLSSSAFSVTYYPWVEIANPFHIPADPDTGADAVGPATIKVGPSSFAAGMWAKIDGRRGVWKAPAGVETALLGVAGLADNVDDKQQGELNPVGINCLRKIPGAGPVIWGSRTLSTMADPEWRYVPVRRTASMIEESIYNNIQWAVFEPNDHRLWSSLRVNIDAFMNGLWRAGAFQGEKASDAYFVRCNLGDTMTQDDIDLGKVIVDVGFAPLKPAEFVIVRIQQKVAQQ